VFDNKYIKKEHSEKIDREIFTDLATLK